MFLTVGAYAKLQGSVPCTPLLSQVYTDLADVAISSHYRQRICTVPINSRISSIGVKENDGRNFNNFCIGSTDMFW